MKRYLSCLVVPVLIGIAAAISAGAATAAGKVTGGAENPKSRPLPARITHYFDPQIEMLVEEGAPQVDRDGKTYVVVPRPGGEYEIHVSNQGTRRVCFVVAVDGLLVMNGEVASDRSSGYVLSPKSNYSLKGWRRGNDKVAAFTFTKTEASNAALKGHPEGIGTIRLTAIEERQAVVLRPSPSFGPFTKTYHARSLGARSLPSIVRGVGTGSGSEKEDRVTTVSFNRSTNVKKITLHYILAEELRPPCQSEAPKKCDREAPAPSCLWVCDPGQVVYTPGMAGLPQSGIRPKPVTAWSVLGK